MEIRRRDGSPYPPNTLTNIASGLQRYMHSCGRYELKLLSKDDPTFALFRKALEARCKELLSFNSVVNAFVASFLLIISFARLRFSCMCVSHR